MNEKERHLGSPSPPPSSVVLSSSSSPPDPEPPPPVVVEGDEGEVGARGAGRKLWLLLAGGSVGLLLGWAASLYSEPGRDRAVLSLYERRVRDAVSGSSVRGHLTPAGRWVSTLGANPDSHFVWPEALWAEAAPAAHRLLQRKLLERTLFYLAPEELTPERVLRLHDFVGQLRGRGVLLYLEPPRLPHWAQGTTAEEGLPYEAYGWLRPGGEREVEDFFYQLRQTPSPPAPGTGAPRTAASEEATAASGATPAAAAASTRPGGEGDADDAAEAAAAAAAEAEATAAESAVGLVFEEVGVWEKRSAFKKFATPFATATGTGADVKGIFSGYRFGNADGNADADAATAPGDPGRLLESREDWRAVIEATVRNASPTETVWVLDGSAGAAGPIEVPSERRGADGGWQALPAARGWLLWPHSFRLSAPPMPVPTPLPPGKELALWGEKLEARAGDEVRLELWISRVEPPPGIDWKSLPLWDPLWRLFHPVKGPAWRVK